MAEIPRRSRQRGLGSRGPDGLDEEFIRVKVPVWCIRFTELWLTSASCRKDPVRSTALARRAGGWRPRTRVCEVSPEFQIYIKTYMLLLQRLESFGCLLN